MHHIKRSAFCTKYKWTAILKPHNGFCTLMEYMPAKRVSELSLADFSSKAMDKTVINMGAVNIAKRLQVAMKSGCGKQSVADAHNMTKTRKDISTVEEPFDPHSPTYNIPETPVTFAEGASYSLVILVGLGIAAAAGYAVFRELIFEPKEYKIFGKALARVQNDSQINFHIRGPSGAGRVHTEMFKDPEDNQWKFTYLIVEIKSPSPARLILESYLPA